MPSKGSQPSSKDGEPCTAANDAFNGANVEGASPLHQPSKICGGSEESETTLPYPAAEQTRNTEPTTRIRHLSRVIARALMFNPFL